MFLRLLVVFSLILSAAGLGILGLQLLAPSPSPAPTEVARVESAPVVAPAPQVRMIVAARPLSIGTLLKDDDFREQDVVADAVPDGAFVGGAGLNRAARCRAVNPTSPFGLSGNHPWDTVGTEKFADPRDRAGGRTGVLREVGPRHAA